ncbi:hypothetical protein MCHI_002532 [Candidatus Magnetoovum chiemensis]|nr:hypothetical protein MCHI_002532 [Candidatus Magnetoovum chiemensis]
MVIKKTISESVPIMEDSAQVEDDNSTPSLKDYAPLKSPIEEAKELFPCIRDFTKEELKRYNDSLSKLFAPTGRNLFDLL